VWSVASAVVQATRSLVDERLIDEYAHLSAAEYGPDAAVSRVDHLRWKYLGCPAGAPSADTIRSGDEAIARIVYEPRQLCSKHGARRALNPIDLLVHPRERSPRLFLDLMRGLREHDDADLIYFVPNDVSAPLYEKVLKFVEVGRLRLTGLPLRPERVLAERIPRFTRPVFHVAGIVWRLLVHARNAIRRIPMGVHVGADPPGDADLDRIGAALCVDDAWVGLRDHAFHHWRFRDGPVFTYRVRYAYRRGTLAGYVASRVVDFEGLRACIVIDCVSVGKRRRRVAARLLADVVSHGRRERVDLVAALSFGRTMLTRSLRQAPLLTVPRRFWPQQMPLHAEWVGPARSAGAPDLSLTLADMDVF